MKKNSLVIHTPKLFYNNDNDICSTINYSAMGLFSITSELKKSQINSQIINLGIEKYLNKKFLLSEYIKENNINFLAFSLNWKEQSYDVIKTAEIIKEKCPDVFISLGGQSASFYAEEIIEKFPFIDAVIKGEGERPSVDLANKFFNKDSFENIPNIVWRKQNKITVNKNNFAASSSDMDNYEFFNPENMLHYREYTKAKHIINYFKQNQLINPSTVQGICLGRGCSGNCVWCGGASRISKLISGRDFISYRSIDKVISDIKLMKEKYNIEYFRFSFDPNPSDRSYLISLFKQIGKYFNGTVNAFYNLDGLPDINFIDAFKKAFSADSLLSLSPVFYNENLRKRYKSFFYTNNQLETILEYMDKKQINSELYFSIMPGVNRDENEASREYGIYLKNKYEFVQNTFMYDIEIEPGSLWTFYPQKFNLKNPKKSFIEIYNDNKSVQKSYEQDFIK